MTLYRYEQLAELAERELELVTAGQLEQAEELQARRAELVATLPPAPPDEARPALERAAEAQRQTTVALAMAARAVEAELARVGGGRRAARSYAPAGQAPGRALDCRT